MRGFLLLFTFLICHFISAQSQSDILHTIFAVGDAGALDDYDSGQNVVMKAMQSHLEEESENSSVVFLGDNIYPAGLPDKEDETYDKAVKILKAQLESLRHYQGKGYFIPGNHDWNRMKGDGLQRVRDMERYVEEYYTDGPKVRFYPNDGCGDPEVVEIDNDHIMIFIDSQWWLEKWEKQDDVNSGCKVDSREELLMKLEEIFREYHNEQIFFFVHHPFHSDGIHGGRFTWKHHLFPLHETSVGYVPLPVIGSIYPLSRSIIGNRQDLPHPLYSELVDGVMDIAKSKDANVYFFSGHEHNLQYFDEDQFHFMISGSGSKVTPVAEHGEAEFSEASRGFMKLTIYESGKIQLDIYTVDPTQPDQGQIVLTKVLKERNPGAISAKKAYDPIPSDGNKIRVVGSEDFQVNDFQRFMFGEQYRSIWSDTVEAGVIDLEKRYGGLTPVKKGGGMSTNSLRLEAQNGKQYNLRTIQKDYKKLIPERFERLKAFKLLADLNSASHPYAAFAIPALAEAADIYHTNPELVYLKKQRGLQDFNDDFNEELYLFEARPDDKHWSDADHFGKPDEIIGYYDVIENLRKKKTHHVDQEWTLRSRLFDIWIHDWDRHDDQWRWAEFKAADSTYYRPIPRDRDQAFYTFNGLAPSLIGAIGVRKFRGMDHELKGVRHQSFNARYFDRYFLNQMEWKDWENQVRLLQDRLTDEVIQKGINTMPSGVDADHKSHLVAMLQSRRDNLMKPARELYEFLSSEVDVPGTEDVNIFDIEIHNDGTVELKVWNVREDASNRLFYHRVFYPDETDEIRLYGRRDDDQFNLRGAGKTSLKIRIIGGEGKDELINTSERTRPLIYDRKDGMTLSGHNKVKDRRQDKIGINRYDRRGFNYNLSFPLLRFGITRDDGLWLGAGYNWTIMGWRKDPFKVRHKVGVSFAPFSNDARSAYYSGLWNELMGKWSLGTDLALQNPRYVNYFGLGNQTKNESGFREFNWVRINTFKSSVLAIRQSRNENIRFYVGPQFLSNRIINVEGRIIDELFDLEPDQELDRIEYYGGKIGYNIGYTDSEKTPTYGFHHELEYSHLKAIGEDRVVRNLSTSMKFYCPIMSDDLTLGVRLGFSVVGGQPEFFQYPSIGNLRGVRGYRRDRFRGEQAAYFNTDLRYKAFRWDNRYLPGDVYAVAGYDIGRVWLDDEATNSTWHESYSFGLAYSIYSIIIVHPYFSFTEEEDLFTLKLGFAF